MLNRKLIISLLCSLPFFGNAQFQHTDGERIVDAEGNEILWRGMGLGGWMLQEGYMLGTSGAQYELENRIDELVGRVKRDEFYEAWWANHMRKIDVDSLAAWGFNMIRLPMHYKLFTPPIEDEPVEGEVTWLDRGFMMTDSLVKWCKSNDLYLILDLHAAPGGQGENADISDYDPSKPSLWESDLNKEKTIALWRKLAERYADEPTIVAYDLINEPNWGFQDHANDPNGCSESQNTPLWNLQKDITNAIREVDTNHIVVIEGNCWGGNYAGLPQLWDDNLVISYHKYWNDENDVSAAVNMRESRGVPVWLGETGENSNTWFTNTVRALERNNIGWAWWPLKKLGLNNALEIPRNDNYQKILDYWDDPSNNPKPDTQEAYEGLMTLAESTKLENAIYHKDVPDALIRQPHTTATIPYVSRKLTDEELVIYASDYDLGRNNYAYYDTDTANYHVTTGNYTAWNVGWSYRNDGVDIEPSGDQDEKSNGFNVGWTNPGEWLQYTLNVDATDIYEMKIRYASDGTGKVKVSVDGSLATQSISLPSTGGWQAWETTTLSNLVLEGGTHNIRLHIENGLNIGYYTLNSVGGLETAAFEGMGARTGTSGFDVVLDLNQPVMASTVEGAEGFELVVDGEVLSAVPSVIDSRKINLTVSQHLYDDNEIKVRYTGNSLLSELAEVPLAEIESLPVNNTLPIHYTIQGTIQAEDFFVNEGLVLEETSDTGGGFNIGYTNVGDYLEYRVNVQDSGLYSIEARVACQSNAGEFRLQQISDDGTVVNEAILNVPVTGGWQEWETISDGEIQLYKGRWVLRLTITDPEFNLNWIRLTKKKFITGINNNSELLLYPNPTQRFLNVSTSTQDQFMVLTMNGSKVLTGLISDSKTIDLKALNSGTYVIILMDTKRGAYSYHRILKRKE